MSENVTHGGARIDWEQELAFIDGLMDENSVTYDHHEPAGMYRDFARRIMLRFAELADIVEAVAATLEPRDHEWCCYYCESPLHAPHFAGCPYRRAREICGMDGAE